MGRKPKQFKKPEDLFGSMAKFLVPENILKDFDRLTLLKFHCTCVQLDFCHLLLAVVFVFHLLLVSLFESSLE